MKTLIVSLVFFVSAVASAQILGVLVNSRPVTTLTGVGYECTYSVGGTTTTIVLGYLCPPTMQFR